MAEGIYFAAYGTPELISTTITSLDPEYHWLFNYSPMAWSIIGIMLFLLIISILKLVGTPRSYTIPLRKAKDTMLLSLLFSWSSVILFPDFWSNGLVYWLATPLTLFYSNFIIHSKRSWVGSFYFLLIVVLGVLWFFIR